MRIKAISLTWFRGAADPVSLEPAGKSMVVYGVNGSGKSSFVDALEYALNDGRIRHLAHEHSGKRQEKAVPNTHVPEGRMPELSITFADDSELKIEIRRDAIHSRSGGETAALGTWDYRRTVLRQDEVAAFIHDTKGGKYSALLPLLGLQSLEVAAENLRQLAKSAGDVARLNETKARLKLVREKRTATFGTDTDDQILAKIGELHAKYCADKAATTDPLSRCKEMRTAIEKRIAESSADQRRHVALCDAADLDLGGHVDAVRADSVKLSGVAEPLIAETLEVLQSTNTYVERLGDAEEVKCPACGRSIQVSVFQVHVKAERQRLSEVIATFDTRKAAIGTLCDSVKSLRASLGKPDVKSWREELGKGSFGDNFARLDGINVEHLRASCGEQDLKAIEDRLIPLVQAAQCASKDAPPDAKLLSTDRQTVEAGEAVIAATQQATAAKRTEALVSFIQSLEQGMREEIRLRSETVIDDISADIQAMWAILHPGEAIENVRLYLPKGADKAIDIGLKFHGVDQDSPRLTLSEGYRNSLGLCIFLAMAKREADKDRPLFLDDVVVSLDRNHRGMIAELLQKEFSGRQVVILTHDREWYTELRHQLDEKSWVCEALLPYETPSLGIRWSHKTTTFDDARAHLKDRPDSAGNDARKIMDVELGCAAERLRIRLPYLRADKNDRRTAHEFLERLVADGRSCFQRNPDTGHKVHQEALDAFADADRLLVSWGNRASHTFDIVRPEAAKLVDVCEKALEFLKCSSCRKPVWFANAAGADWVQCQCGQIRWRYGKAT
jgi:recombinational DNA repair ATPase RecF